MATRPLITDVLGEATTILRAAGIASAERDAVELLGHVLRRADEPLGWTGVVDETAQRRFGELLRRRTAHEPLAHLTGQVRFRQVDVLVGPGVFVPQPETQSLIDWCADVLAAWRDPVIVDLASGAGAIPLCLASERPDAVVHAVEIDRSAFSWLQRNVRRTGSRVLAHHADLSDALHELDGAVDLVVSNPPYVADDELAAVDPEVRDHDPLIAISGGVDGLGVIRAAEQTARRLLRPGGVFAIEHSDRQGESVPDLLMRSGCWSDIADHADHAGRARFTTARLHSPRGGAHV